ncbi:MAG: DUF4173 domain-containing protein [Clostridia bacterium]|nr:DUF4173 domain-containing protein [Clostridia bacterium]
MKPIIKGFLLALALMYCNRFLGSIFQYPHMLICIVFFSVTAAFLVSEKISHLFLCGFTGLFSLIILEFSVATFSPHVETLLIHLLGMPCCFLAIPPAIVLTVKKPKIHLREECFVEQTFKIKLLIYAAITACTFTLFVMPERAGISVPFFVLIQAICLWFLVPNRKRLFLLIPVGIFSLNCFFSGSHIWRISNFFVSAILFSCMFLNFSFFSSSLKYLTEAICRFFAPLTAFTLPFRWVSELTSGKTGLIKRILLALLLALPCALILVFILSHADMVFSMKTESVFSRLTDGFRLHSVWLILCGICAGLYAFGCLYTAHVGVALSEKEKKSIRCDLMIVNIFLAVILAVYTLFVIIQFRYLFAGDTLPSGLSYTEYARKGFFELLGLTGVNIFLILLVIHLTRESEGIWTKITRMLLHYLCAVTVVLLISSFYRMYLYTADDGLTRLRFFVMGFLVFEAIGLLFTFLYIAKPKFSITGVYLTLALTYYCLLNLVPTDNIIAQNQIDKYLVGEREGIDYVFTLSTDAAPAMEALYAKTNDTNLHAQILTFLSTKTASDIPKRWQRYNLSHTHASEVLNDLK